MKKFASVVAIITVAILCVCMCACNSTTGLSAYEIAIRNGFVGTEAQWLASLAGSDSGRSAYDIAIDNGFNGTEAEWLASLKGTDGANGVDGKDAPAITITDVYEAMKADGYTGDFNQFISDYLDSAVLNNTGESYVSRAVLSCVSVFCTFTKTTTKYTGGGWFGGGTYENVDEDYSTAGSGVIYKLDKESGNAYVITNYHVVFDPESNSSNKIAKEISVYIYGKQLAAGKIIATYVGGSLNYDIAVLKIENSDILKNSDARAAEVYNSNDVVIGQTAIAIGNPEASGISVTSGIVSVDSESLDMTGADNVTPVSFRVMRVDTAVNSGNSGGGLFDEYGRLIGIVNAKIKSTDVENIGYAIPSNVATYVADNIIDYCNGTTETQVNKCMLGISIQAIDSKAVYEESSQLTRLYETIQVKDVTQGALASGVLQVDDIIKSISINGVTHQITRNFIVVDLMLTVRVGDQIVLTYERGGATLNSTITLTQSCITKVS